MILSFMLISVARMGYESQVVAFCMLESCCRCLNLAVMYPKSWRKHRLSCISYEKGIVRKKIVNIRAITFKMETDKTFYFSLKNVVVET